MRTILFASIILFVSGGVATADDFKPDKPNKCAGTGLTNVKIQYGDGKFLVDAVVKSRRAGELRFQLYPDRDSELGVDYATVKVEIVGKNNQWLNKVRKQTGHYISVCVPEDLETGTYMYSVKFTDTDSEPEELIGLVDPKVIIEPD